MDDLPRQKLCELIRSYGTVLCDEPLRCEGLLKDLAPRHRREVNVLITALKAGVAGQLLSSSASVPMEITLGRLSHHLRDDQALSGEAARWAVESWALALRKVSPAELSTHIVDHSAPRTATAKPIIPASEEESGWPLPGMHASPAVSADETYVDGPEPPTADVAAPQRGLSRVAPWLAAGALAGLLVTVAVVFFASTRKPQKASVAISIPVATTSPATIAISKPTATAATDLDRAEKDYAQAMDLLTGMNRVQIDINESLRLLRQAATAHLPEAEARLALITKIGYDGLIKDQSKAESLANAALSDGLVARADDQHPAAENVLGLLYSEGIGVPKDLTKAVDLIQKAADRGHAGALSNLARLYAAGDGVPKNLNRAFELFQKAGDQGQASAQTYLGSCYENGLGVSKNLDKALELYQKAADQGDAGGQSNLARLYATGMGVSKNLYKALELYQKAAAQSDARGQAGLGWLYENGYGVPKDFYKAAELYQKSADQGSPLGQTGLGWLYQNGWGLPKDLEKAAELYQKAANHGYAGGQARLGWLYLSGLGVSKDFYKAAELFQKAADQGNPDAQANLGYLYSTGQGIEENYNKACELFQKAADQGVAHAKYNLGTMYDAGKGVERNHEKALGLYRQAADQNDPDAQKALQAITQVEGAWAGSNGTWNAVMTITAAGTARMTMDFTERLRPGSDHWNNIPAPYNKSRTLHYRWSATSSSVQAGATSINIYWTDWKLSWDPSGIPYSVLKKNIPNTVSEPNRAWGFTLNGTQLVSGSWSFHRKR